MTASRFWRRARTGVLALAMLTAVIVGPANAANAAAGPFVSVPAGWNDSRTSAVDTGQGGRRVYVNNGSPDYVTIDVWASGTVLVHHRISPRTNGWQDYGVFFDATVTRWRDCSTTGCVIAGVYKWSALTSPNGYIPPGPVWNLIPPP